MNMLMVLGLGLLLGLQHATEADHLAAVATLCGREHSVKQGLRLGLAWGLGHTLTLLLVAGGIGLLGWVISPQLAGRFEQVVGAMLVVLGANLGLRMWRERVHFHAHRHEGGDSHVHFHGHPQARATEGTVASFKPQADQPHEDQLHHHPHHMPARGLLVGMVHGLAGSAALALMASQTLPTPAAQLLYIALFGLGSLLGMALLSGALAYTLGRSAARLTLLNGAFNAVVAALSVLLGLRLLVVNG